MGFLEKVKNMFTEEVEEDEVKVEKVDKVKKEIIASFSDSEEKKENEEILPVKENIEDTKPVFFDDDDFDDLEFSKKDSFDSKIEKKESEKEDKPVKLREDKHIKKGNYKDMMKESFEPHEEVEAEEKKIFKPTPIISPIYGILDKNYHKEDIVSKNEVQNYKKDDELKEPSIDSVRDKAYGTLEDELENTLFGSNSILFKDTDEKKEEKAEVKEVENFEDNTLNLLTDEISKKLDELLVKKGKKSDEVDVKEETDNGIKEEVEDKKEDLNEEDLLGFIDSTLYKEGDEY